MNSISDRSVFINCPFDPQFKPLLDALVFATSACTFEPRCALEVSNAIESRLQKILRIIRECRFGIHDISRVELDQEHNLPRLNMAFELGLFLGAQTFGDSDQQRKNLIVMDTSKYRYQKMLSDLSGIDIKEHKKEVERVIGIVRDWLQEEAPVSGLPSGGVIHNWYSEFTRQLDDLANRSNLIYEELTFLDYRGLIEQWLAKVGGAK